VFLADTVDWLRSMSPDLEALYEKYKGKKPGDANAVPDQHGALDQPANKAGG
jgi:hypothetical protein